MPDPTIKNIPASIRQKLLNLAQERNDDFGFLLTKYGLERILFRLSKSKYRDVFILKGALLFELWTKERYRATRDADFVAKGDNSPERFVRIFQEIVALEVEADGLRFDPKTVEAERIKEDADYEGVRVTFTAFLDKARIPIQIDISFGDAIRPGPVETDYPTLLDLPSPLPSARNQEELNNRDRNSVRELTPRKRIARVVPARVSHRPPPVAPEARNPWLARQQNFAVRFRSAALAQLAGSRSE